GLCRDDANLERPVERARTPEQKLLAIVRADLVAILQEDRNAFTINLTEYRALSPGSKERIVRLRDTYEKRFGKVIEQLVDSKIIAGHPRILRLFLLGALNWTIEWYKPKGELSVNEFAEQFSQLILGK